MPFEPARTTQGGARAHGEAVLAGEGDARAISITGEVLLGRGDDVTLPLDDDEVSRRHARLYKVDDIWHIEDLASRNGTFVNGMPIIRQVLCFGDRISLGANTHFVLTRPGGRDSALRHGKRLQVVGELSAGLAHDLNNSLGVILASLDYLVAEADALSEDGRECLEDALTAAKAAAELPRRILSMSRATPTGAAAISLSRVVEEAAGIMRRTAPQLLVRTEVAPDVTIVGDAVELHAALMNLCVNARDAMADGGVLSLRLEAVDDHCQLTVQDTGTGMPESTQARMFEPYFTTKPDGRGTGLGLPAVRACVQAHGGTIDVVSAPGVGTTFTLRFSTSKPRHRHDTEPPAAPDLRPDLLGWVWLEDPAVCRAALRLLDRLNVTTETLPNLDAALLPGDGPDFVLLDAADLGSLHALSQARPTLPLLFLSSDTGPLLALQRQDCVAVRMPLSAKTLREGLLAVSEGRATKPSLRGLSRRQAETIDPLDEP